MAQRLNTGLDRRDFLTGTAAVLATPMVVPHVFGAPSRPDMVVVKGGAALDPAEAAYQRMQVGFERMGGLTSTVKGRRVLVKLNATERTSQDGNTSVDAARALLRLLKEGGAGSIMVLGQEWGGFDSPRAGQPTLRKVIGDAECKLFELPHYWTKGSEQSYKLMQPEGDLWHELWVAKDIFEKDTVLLNLARLKTHPHCVYTGCIKNVIGLTRRMYGFHKVDDAGPPKNHGNPAATDGWGVFSQKLSLAFRDVIGPKIALNILDAGRPTFGWRGPASEKIQTFVADTTIVGTDALAMDVYGCDMLHAERPDSYVAALGDWSTGENPYVKHNKTKMNYLAECGRLQVGQADLKKVNIDEATIG